MYEAKVFTLLTIQLFAFSHVHVQLTGFSTSSSPRIAACVAGQLSPVGVWSGHETKKKGDRGPGGAGGFIRTRDELVITYKN